MDILKCLQNECLHISDVDDSYAERYHKALAKAREDKEEDLIVEEIKRVIAEVNETVEQEQLSEWVWKVAVLFVDECMEN